MNTSIRYTTRKKDKQFLFEVQLNWLDGTRGILSAKDADGTLHVATPSELGGEAKHWTPEHLFLSSISSCYMTTYLVYAKKLGFEISHFDCNAIGQTEIIKGKYKFTNINLFPRVYITEEELRDIARIAMEKTHKNCLITNSVNTTIFYHSEILIDPHPRHEIKDATGLKTVYMTAKIAWEHLHEIPDYYTRLEKMGKDAEEMINKN